MKKIKKMLAGLLGAAMVLTSFGTPTWADSATRPTLPTIDTTQKGLNCNPRFHTRYLG